MIVYENDCCSCETEGYPCTGEHKHVPHLYCDRCKEEIEEAYDVDGEHLCHDCLVTRYPLKSLEDFL